MKAVIRTKYGSPDILRIIDTPKPTPKDNEVLIKIYATTVNRTDCGYLSGQPFFVRFFIGLFGPKHKILGNEFAGTVEAIGANVTLFKKGDKVFGYNEITFGGHAEYMTMAEDSSIASIPGALSYNEAAPIAEGAHYALCNIRAAKIKQGQNVLINGATGAIGSAAVQISKYFGASVTAVCDTRNMHLVKSIGADIVIDYTKGDFTKTDQKFDVVFDAVGKSSFAMCKPILNPNGIYMSTELGPNNQNPFLALSTSFSNGKKVLFPIPTINKEDILLLKSMVEDGMFKPVIDSKSYTLDQVVAAYKYVETGWKTGNVVIMVA